MRYRGFQGLGIEWLGDHECRFQRFAGEKALRKAGHKDHGSVYPSQDLANGLDTAVAVLKLDIGQDQIRPGLLGQLE